MPTTTAVELYPKETAALLRSILRRAFPATRFRVTTARGSMVSAVDIRWTDGPTADRVEALTRPFQCGAFDSMTDGYDYATGADRFVIVGGTTYKTHTRYVHTHRDISPTFAQKLASQVCAYFGLETPAVRTNKWGGWDLSVDPRLEDDYLRAHIYRASEDRTRYTPASA